MSADALALERPRLIHDLADALYVQGAEARRALTILPRATEQVSYRSLLSDAGQPQRCVWLVTSGLFCEEKLTNAGNRQVLGIYMPGDLVNLNELSGLISAYSVRAITPCEAIRLPIGPFEECITQHREVTKQLWRYSARMINNFASWVARVGHGNSRFKLANLFCELIQRQAAVGCKTNNRILFPLRQIDAADATGMTTVHLCRTFRELIREGALLDPWSQLTIADWSMLCRIGQFEEGRRLRGHRHALPMSPPNH